MNFIKCDCRLLEQTVEYLLYFCSYGKGPALVRVEMPWKTAAKRVCNYFWQFVITSAMGGQNCFNAHNRYGTDVTVDARC